MTNCRLQEVDGGGGRTLTMSYLAEEVERNAVQRGRSGGKMVKYRTVGQANQK